MRRALVAVVVLSGLGGIAGPALAATSLPVGVQVRNDDSGVGVGTTINGQPGASVWYDRKGQQICPGFSYEVARCVAVPLN